MAYKSVLITGVSKGMGQALAVEFLKTGATVYGVSRSEVPSIKAPNFRSTRLPV